MVTQSAVGLEAQDKTMSGRMPGGGSGPPVAVLFKQQSNRVELESLVELKIGNGKFDQPLSTNPVWLN